MVLNGITNGVEWYTIDITNGTDWYANGTPMNKPMMLNGIQLI